MKEFDYTTRISSQAKSLRLSVSAQKGLVVIIPDFLQRKQGLEQAIDALLVEKADWITRMLTRFEKERASYSACVAGELPLFAECRVVSKTLSFLYVQREVTTVQARLDRDGGIVTVTGALSNKAAAVKALQRFNKRYATEVLEPLVYELADTHRLRSPKSVHIKLMRTRWGSYSSHGSLNLSQNLIFLPRELATHVILHELAHTKHLDHGREFHALLAKLDPNKENHVVALREGQSYIPTWADVHV